MRAGRGGARAKPRLALLGDVGAQRAYNLFRAHDCDRCLLRRFDSNARRGVVAKRGPPCRHIARRRRRSCRPPVARGRAPGRRPRRVPRDRGGTRRRRPSVIIANRDPLRGRVRRGSRPCPRPRRAQDGQARARRARRARARFARARAVPVASLRARLRRALPRHQTRARGVAILGSRRVAAHAPRVRPPSSLLRRAQSREGLRHRRALEAARRHAIATPGRRAYDAGGGERRRARPARDGDRHRHREGDRHRRSHRRFHRRRRRFDVSSSLHAAPGDVRSVGVSVSHRTRQTRRRASARERGPGMAPPRRGGGTSRGGRPRARRHRARARVAGDGGGVGDGTTTPRGFAFPRVGARRE